jgi:hypothetical protein
MAIYTQPIIPDDSTHLSEFVVNMSKESTISEALIGEVCDKLITIAGQDEDNGQSLVNANFVQAIADILIKTNMQVHKVLQTIAVLCDGQEEKVAVKAKFCVPEIRDAICKAIGLMSSHDDRAIGNAFRAIASMLYYNGDFALRSVFFHEDVINMISSRFIICGSEDTARNGNFLLTELAWGDQNVSTKVALSTAAIRDGIINSFEFCRTPTSLYEAFLAIFRILNYNGNMQARQEFGTPQLIQAVEQARAFAITLAQRDDSDSKGYDAIQTADGCRNEFQWTADHSSSAAEREDSYE